MFKNLKQKLENLNSQSGKSGPSKPEEVIESVQETSDKSAKNSDQKLVETVETTVSTQGGVSAVQSENSDAVTLTNEELDKTNRVLLSQIRELEECKRDVGRRLNRRIGELEEQIELDKQAKRDLEHSYALMLDEKDELITVLKTQVQLLKSNQTSLMGSSSDDPDDQLASKNESMECPLSLEEIALLKEKVKRLESLLTKCKDTIKSNKERSRQLTTENEELKKSYENKLAELQLKHELEMDSKMADLKEEIKSLTEVRTGLDDKMVSLSTKLSEKEKIIESKEKIFNDKMEKVKMDMERLNSMFKQQQEYQKSLEGNSQSSKGNENSTSDAAGDSTDSETDKDGSSQTDSFAATKKELEHLKELYELKSKELNLVIEERETVRKELSTQRQKFATVLERYDEQMKVVQGELMERMKPGPFEAGLIKEVQTILSETPPPTMTRATEESDECTKSTKGDETAASSSCEVKSDAALREEFKVGQMKLARVLGLLEKCAKEIDKRDAFDNRWKERMSEAETRHAAQFRESQDIIDRLNSQIMELTNRENALNANLELARQQSDAILEEQRSEMAARQRMVDELLERERQLRAQIQRTKLMCDAEVARVSAENLESVQRLSDTFQETQSTLADLSKELLESKGHSEMVIGSLERDLDEKCCMLQKTADYIETSGDDALKAAFMKIVLECSSGQMVSGKEEGKESDPRSDVPSSAEGNGSLVDATNNNQDGMVPESSSSVVVSVENCKSLVMQDKKEVKISSQCQQELIDFDFPKDKKLSLSTKSLCDDKKHAPSLKKELIGKVCSHRKSMSKFLEQYGKECSDGFFEIKNLKSPLKGDKFSKYEEKCKELGVAISSLVRVSHGNLRELRADETCSINLRDPELCLKEPISKMDDKNFKIAVDISTSQVSESQKPQSGQGELTKMAATSEITIDEMNNANSKFVGERMRGYVVELKEDMENLRPFSERLQVDKGPLGEETVVGLQPGERESLQLPMQQKSIYSDRGCDGFSESNSMVHKSSDDMKSLLCENAKLKLEIEERIKNKLVETNFISTLKIELEALMQENSKIKAILSESETKLEELEHLKEEMAQKELNYKQVECEYEENMKTLAKVKATMESERTQYQHLEEEKEIIKLELQESHNELNLLKREIMFHTMENEKFIEKLSSLEKEKEKDSLMILNSMQDKESLQEKLNSCTKLLDETKTNSEAEINLFKMLLDEKQTYAFEQASLMEGLQKDKESLALDKQNLHIIIENLKLENIELHKDAKRLTEKLEELESKLHFKGVELEEMTESKLRCEANIKKMEDTLKIQEVASDNYQKSLSEKVYFVQQLEEKVNSLVLKNGAICEEKEVLVRGKNQLLNHCLNIMSNAQILLTAASSKIATLTSKVSEITILKSKLEEQLKEKEDFVASLIHGNTVSMQHDKTALMPVKEIVSNEVEVYKGFPEFFSNNKNDSIHSVKDVHDKDSLLQKQLDDLRLCHVLKEKELEEMKESHESLLHRCEEAEMALNKKQVYYEDVINSAVINKFPEHSVNAKNVSTQSVEEFHPEKEIFLQPQLDDLRLSLMLKEKELEEMRQSHDSLLQRCEEAEMALNKKQVYYEDSINSDLNISESIEFSFNAKTDCSLSVEEFHHDKEICLQQQLDDIRLSFVLKEKELEEIRQSHESLLQRCEEAEMTLSKKCVYYEDASNSVVKDSVEEVETSKGTSFETKIMPLNTTGSEQIEENMANLKVKINFGSSNAVGESVGSCHHLESTQALMMELEEVKKLLKESQQEVELLKQQELNFSSRRDCTNSKSRSSPMSREHLDSLDLSQDIFLSPEKTSGNKAGHRVTSVDDHGNMFIDLSPMRNENKVAFGLKGCNEKSDSELLDISDPGDHSEHCHSPKELTYEYLEKQYHLLTKEVERMNSELHFYYANGHLKYHQDIIGKHDSFLDLTEPTELEYLRNVLYKYMLGMETKTLAKVICMVVRFSEDQTKRILEKEESRASVFGMKK